MTRPKKRRHARSDGTPAPPLSPDPFRRHALIVVAVALAVRLVHVWQISPAPFFNVLMGDSRGYDEWARRIAGGDWIGTEVFYQAPLYPYVLGTINAIAGRDLFMVRVVQAVLGSIGCIALGYAAHRLVSARVGLIAGLMLALYAPAIFFDALIQKSILDVFFVCLMLAVIGRLIAGPEEGWLWIVLGLVVGGLSLTRENAMVFVAVILLWAVLRNRGVYFREVPVGAHRPIATSRVLPAALFVAGLAVVLAPVAARNYAVGGGFYLTTSQFGSNLYIGNNPRADGSYMSLRFGRGAPEYERQDAKELAEQATGRSMTPGDVSRYWTDRTLAYIASHPGGWLELLARKTWLLWNATELLDTESQETHAEWSWPLKFGGYVWHFGVLLPLAVIGLATLWPERQRLWVLYVMWFAYAASVVLFFVFARYRFPMVPFVILFASAGVAALPRLVKAPERRTQVALAAVVVLVAIVTNWPVYTADSNRAITENNLGTAFQADGRLQEAIDRYQRALALDPNYAPALGNLGTALRATGRTEEAIAVYERALQLQPDFPSVHYNLGNLRLSQGQPDAAAAAFSRALERAPDSVEAHNNLGLALEAQGRLDDAIAEFRAALALDNASAQAHSNLGNALASKGDGPQAIAELTRAIELDPANASTRYDLGSVLLEMGRFREAATAFQDALRLNPSMAEAHNNLGITLASMGQLDAAITHWEQALKIKPGFADAERNLATAKTAKSR